MPQTTKANPSKRDQPSAGPSQGQKQAKVMITGDDILIEYVSRLGRTLSLMHEDTIESTQRQRMEKFVSHYVWHMPD